MKSLIVVLLLTISAKAMAQFAPQVGLGGSTAIHKSSSSIKSWAKECIIQRGYIDIADKSAGYTTTGDSSNAIGIADGEVVSMGDSGIATVQFSQAIYNGEGADFVIFENGFQNPANLEEAFLELAFVEVSSDGVNYFRFPATSNTQSLIQIKGSGDYMNARQINNLAGKYTSQYGTPFDLEELKSKDGLDVNHITHVRIIDVIGDIGTNASKDANGQKINDPYPTPFPTGGFDLDAVGAIHFKGSKIIENYTSKVQIFPNPTSAKLFIELESTLLNSNAEILIRDMSGRILLRQNALQQNTFDIESFQSGLYLISLLQSETNTCLGKFSKL